MLQTNYEEMIVILKEKGEVEIPLTDCDMQFYIEDTLESLDLKYQKLIPPVRRGAVKTMIIKIED
ncbi:hypothetical protein [Bacillus sp. CECT 9360]|uniref:hypothetical protein n=1 Tax=Bacillus sp. CECT 9360 TaxID=2845821 RepID=UPI001E357818|nr:hypothetical protein [Bacillus sp. CECT 9360]CAH0344225.1 hypothetical protein BCI9360_00467 [Bacillus sp. CECT 9360]